MKRISLRYPVLLAAGLVLAATLLPGGSAEAAAGSRITRSSVLSSVNEVRASLDLPPLQRNRSLERAAREKLDDMIERGYFAHVDPDGKYAWYLITENGYAYASAGENLARRFTTTKRLLGTWTASPSHRANIVSASYVHTGVAVKRGYVVQIFARPIKLDI